MFLLKKLNKIWRGLKTLIYLSIFKITDHGQLHYVVFAVGSVDYVIVGADFADAVDYVTVGSVVSPAVDYIYDCYSPF